MRARLCSAALWAVACQAAAPAPNAAATHRSPSVPTVTAEPPAVDAAVTDAPAADDDTPPGVACVDYEEAMRRGAELLQQMIPDAQRVGHDRQCGVHRAAGDEEAAIDDVEILQLMSLAVRVENAGFRVISEADCAALMRHARKRNSLTEIQIPREQSLVALVAMDRAFPLAEAAAALHYVEAEHARAKVVITNDAVPGVP